MAKPSPSVDGLLSTLNHAAKPSALLIRKLILAENPELTEHVKWNAPSFCDGGDDRVTFRFPPKGGALQLIFHRGAKPKSTTGFRFDDPTGLIEWAAADRGVLTLGDEATAQEHGPAIASLVGAWVRATRSDP